MTVKKNKIISSHTGFQSLEEVWLGGTYPINFYDNLDQEVFEGFARVTELTNITLSKTKKKLEELGVKVRQPMFDADSSFYRDAHDKLIKPPICPRDFNLTLGETMYNVNIGWEKNPFQHVIDEYEVHGEKIIQVDRAKDMHAWVGYGETVRLGRDLYIDVEFEEKFDNKRLQKCIEGFNVLADGYRKHFLHIGGHADGVFCPVKEGLLISTHYAGKKIYQETFPGWEVFWLNDLTQKRKATAKQSKIKLEHSRWWTPDNNFMSPIFSNYIYNYAKNWGGNAAETIFDVNMLVVDEKNVICVVEDDSVLGFLHKQNINVHVIKHPARGFWDAGFHCMSSDIRRNGECKDYFPKREKNFERHYH